MTKLKEPKPLKALYIVGPNLSIPNDIKTLFNNRKDDCLIIGNGSAAITVKDIESTLKEKNFKITQGTRIDIDAHGYRANDGQHHIGINNTSSLTKQVFKELREMAKCPLYVHLWSCYGGSANKVASSLGNDSILITHVESKFPSIKELNNYAMRASLERYLHNSFTASPYQQFILDSPKNFESATFNKVGEDGTKQQFKSTRMLMHKEKKMADILEKLSTRDNLTNYFNDFFAKEGERFHGIFNDVNITNEINFVSKLDDSTIQTFMTSVLIYLYAIKTDTQFMFSFKQLADTLIQQKIDINSPINGTTALHEACYAGNINIVRMLLEYGVDPNIKNKDGNTTPLYWACEKGYISIVKMLLEHGADPNIKNKDGNTPLYYACQQGNSDVVETLMAHKADPNIKGMGGNTPLYYACQQGNSDVVETLMAHKADPNIKGMGGNTPLYYACQQGNSDVVETLMAHKADPNIKGMGGNTPLYWACFLGHINIVKILLEHNTDINIQSMNGNTPLHWACLFGHINIVKMLLEHGADPNIKCMNGNIPLHFACQAGHIEVIKELLKTPAAFGLLNIKNNNDKIPVELIPKANKEAIVSLIAELKKPMHSKDKNLALDKAKKIDDSLVNQQMLKENSEQVSNNEPQNDLKLTELPLIGHTEGTFIE